MKVRQIRQRVPAQRKRTLKQTHPPKRLGQVVAAIVRGTTMTRRTRTTILHLTIAKEAAVH